MPNPQPGGKDDAGLNLKYAHKTIFMAAGSGIAGDGTSLGVGGQIAEIAASGLAGVSMDDAGPDTLYGILDPLDCDIDLTQDIQARVLFVSASTDLDAGTVWKIDAKGLAIGEVVASAGSTPDGSATFVGITMTATANKLTATEWAALSVANELTLDTFIMLMLSLVTWAGTADEPIVLAIQLRGARKITNDSGRQST